MTNRPILMHTCKLSDESVLSKSDRPEILRLLSRSIDQLKLDADAQTKALGTDFSGYTLRVIALFEPPAVMNENDRWDDE